MASQLAASLAAINDGWLEVESSDQGQKWLPLVRVSETGIWLGLSADGEWAIGRPREGAAIESRPAVQSWLTVLDWDMAEFIAELSRVACELNLDPIELERRLPVDDVVTMGLRSESKHWAKRAVVWLQNRRLTNEHRKMLSDLVTERWADQWTRHAASRALRSDAA